jgi:hypothetical protein
MLGCNVSHVQFVQGDSHVAGEVQYRSAEAVTEDFSAKLPAKLLRSNAAPTDRHLQHEKGPLTIANRSL